MMVDLEHSLQQKTGDTYYTQVRRRYVTVVHIFHSNFNNMVSLIDVMNHIDLLFEMRQLLYISTTWRLGINKLKQSTMSQ